MQIFNRLAYNYTTRNLRVNEKTCDLISLFALSLFAAMLSAKHHGDRVWELCTNLNFDAVVIVGFSGILHGLAAHQLSGGFRERVRAVPLFHAGDQH